jgi:hypothetical protein
MYKDTICPHRGISGLPKLGVAPATSALHMGDGGSVTVQASSKLPLAQTSRLPEGGKLPAEGAPESRDGLRLSTHTQPLNLALHVQMGCLPASMVIVYDALPVP